MYFNKRQILGDCVQLVLTAHYWIGQEIGKEIRHHKWTALYGMIQMTAAGLLPTICSRCIKITELELNQLANILE